VRARHIRAAQFLASLASVVPDIVTTVTAIVGVAGMIYGLATGILIVLNREADE
jgi:hypothetical protein